MNPSFLNLFMKKFTRDRVVPTMPRQRRLGNLSAARVGLFLFSVARQQQERPRQALFAGVEKLIDQVSTRMLCASIYAMN